MKFLKSLKGEVGIFFDGDADGTCSGALLAAFLKSRGLKPKLFTGSLDREQFAVFCNQKLDAWIFTDFPIDGTPDWLVQVMGRPVMSIDHHPVVNDLNKLGVVYVNPRMADPGIYYCSSHVALDIVSKAGLKGVEWLSLIGQAGDHEIEGSDDERTAVDLINAVVASKDNETLAKLANYLSECSSFKQFLTEPRYLKLKTAFDKEIEKQIALYEVGATGEVTFFEVRSKFSISSILSTKLFDMYPRRTIIIYSRKGHGWGVSGRSKKYDIGKAFKAACEGIGQGGGHPVAAGAWVSDFEKFKRRLQQLLK